MTLGATRKPDGDDAAAALRAWRSVRDSSDIQFVPLPPARPPVATTPNWLELLGRILRVIFEPIGRLFGMSWPVLQTVLLVLAGVLVLFILWRLVAVPWLARRRPAATPEPEWAPDRATAMALLDDADGLAREGRFAEAVHLLLRRSVGQIALARPEWLRPASTAREIAALPSLPERARVAFTVIAARVERSRFAHRELDRGDWDAARAAYADFALARLQG